MLFVPTMKVLAEWFRVREFATMTGILVAMGGLGVLTAATPLALLSTWIGWRLSFVVVGICTLFLGVLVWAFVRDRPADLGWPSPSEPSGPAPAAIGLLQGMKKVLTYPWFWPIAIWFFFDCAVFFSFGGLWGGPYLMQVYGLSKAKTGHVLSMIAIGMIVGSPLLSLLSNRVFQARKPMLVLSSLVVLCLTALLAFYTDKLPLVGMAGTSTGLVNLFPFAGGAVFQPVLGYLLERHGQVDGIFTLAGYKEAFFVLFLCALIAFFATLFLRETLNVPVPGNKSRQ